jgi:hypothetical protein
MNYRQFFLEELGQSFSGKTFISVDIQPEYEKSFGFKTHQYISFLSEIYDEVNQLVFLYNGVDTLGMISEFDYKTWLIENGLSEEILESSIFYDKGYAFFRYCMDSGIDEDSVSNFVRFMYENDIHDSRDLDRNAWAQYLRQYRKIDKKEVYNLLKTSGDSVHIPDLMDFLKRFNNVVLTGGGVNECLKEVEIAFKALNKPYSVYSKFIY